MSPLGLQKIVAVAPHRLHMGSTWTPHGVHVDYKWNVAQCKALRITNVNHDRVLERWHKIILLTGQESFHNFEQYH